MSKQPEALRLADALTECHYTGVGGPDLQAAAELRRLHEANQELLKALKLIAEMDMAGAEDRAKALMADVMVFKAKEAYAKHGKQA